MTAKSQSGFAERTGEFFTAAARAARAWYDDTGKWVAPTQPSETRERFWLCCALYATGEAEFADAIIRPGETAEYHGIRFNIFDTNIAAALLAHHRDKMAPDVRAKLERLVRDGFSFKPGNRQPDYQFHGYNDNMPAKATMGLVLGGEMLGDDEAVQYGLWNLRQLRAMLVRCGTNSEFNSPTYSALTIHSSAEIAGHARTPEARDIARGIEERLWIDLAARFHPETGVIAGPYSRAYTVDTIAHLSCVSSLLWFVLGDRVNPSPMVLFDPPPALVAHHMGDYPFNIAQMCWYGMSTYHVPPAAARMFEKKRYPFRAVATTEQGDFGPDFPARACRIESCLQPDFTLATSSTSMCGGEQTMSYFVTYRRRKTVRSFRDVGTVFTKIVVNDGAPGAIEAAPHGTNRGESDHLASRANTFTLQSDATALVLTHPHLALGGAPDTSEKATSISALSEMVIFPSHFGGADEILVGGQKRRSWSGAVEHGQWIACRRGRLLIAIRPLAYSRTFGPAALTLERINNYEVIRAAFYRGAERKFQRQELRHMFGGFVAEHASADAYPSLRAFAKECAAARFTDYFWTTRRVRYRRPAGTQSSRRRPALEMEVSWSPGCHLQRIAAINGRAVEWPAVRIDGLNDRRLPFLNERFRSVPSFFPWKKLEVEWYDWPSAIGDREED